MTSHVDDRLSAYLDDELSGIELSRVKAHLAECAACAERLAELTAVDALARGEALPVPDGYFDDLPQRVRQRLPERPTARRLLPRWTWAAAAAALIAVLAPLTLERGMDLAQPPEPASRARELADGKLEQRSQAAALGEAATEEDAVGDAFALGAPPSKASLEGVEDSVSARQGSSDAARDELPAESLRTAAAAPTEAPPSTSLRAEAQLDEAVGRDRERSAAKRKLVAPTARRDADAPAGARPAATPGPAGFATADSVAEEAPAEPLERGDGRVASGVVAGAVEQSRAEPAAPPPPPARAEREARASAATPARLRTANSPVAADRALSLRRERDRLRLQLRDSPEAEEAETWRVRVIELGVEIYRRTGRSDDLEDVRRDAKAYLATDTAREQDRVRALLDSLGLEPGG